MNLRFINVGLILFVLIGLGLGSASAVQSGQEAPAFTLKDTLGKEHSLKDCTGKYVVLEWINHSCPFVKKHYQSGNMPGLQKKYTDKDVVWFSVCSSAPGKAGNLSSEKWNEMIKKKGAAPTAVLLDEDGTVGRAYGAKTTPHMFVIDPKGVLIYQGAIDSIRSADTGDIEKAENYVAKAIDAAMSGKAVEPSRTQPYGCGVKY